MGSSHQARSCKKYKTIFVKNSIPPIANPTPQLPLIKPETKIVSKVPIILQVIVLAKCLL